MQNIRTALTPIERLRCPRCQNRMAVSCVEQRNDGFEKRMFECQKCQFIETKMVPDPLRNPKVSGWLAGELKRPG